MNDLYGPQHLQLQDQFDTLNLAAGVQQAIVAAEIAEPHQWFIESRDMFFLTTIDHRGFPTCSYKGGTAGFVKVLDSKTLAFPSYDGNGMFLSMGNISANNKVGLLFIDFETPHRIRVHGIATIHQDTESLADFYGAELVVKVEITEIFINCPRYIHQYQRVKASKYAPQAGQATPAPQWKRIDALQPVLPDRDKHIAESLGGTISQEDYIAMIMQGEG